MDLETVVGLCRYTATDSTGPTWGWISKGAVVPVPTRLVSAMFAAQAGGMLHLALHTEGGAIPLSALLDGSAGQLVAPVPDTMEIWAAGVTYESSKFARIAESGEAGDFYARVYLADRPELFLKAIGSRVVGYGADVGIRGDSVWSVPEPELVAVLNGSAQVIGWCVGNDMSSRDIEGENPLYLPQAKIYHNSCALGPWITPAEQIDYAQVEIRITIDRSRAQVFAGSISAGRMRRNPQLLADWLVRCYPLPAGAALFTGTGIIPPDDFTLHALDIVSITMTGLGTLTNMVQVVNGGN